MAGGQQISTSLGTLGKLVEVPLLGIEIGCEQSALIVQQQDENKEAALIGLEIGVGIGDLEPPRDLSDTFISIEQGILTPVNGTSANVVFLQGEEIATSTGLLDVTLVAAGGTVGQEVGIGQGTLTPVISGGGESDALNGEAMSIALGTLVPFVSNSYPIAIQLVGLGIGTSTGTLRTRASVPVRLPPGRRGPRKDKQQEIIREEPDGTGAN